MAITNFRSSVLFRISASFNTDAFQQCANVTTVEFHSHTMAAVPIPPRKRSALKLSKKVSSDQILVQMGFPRARVDKALAATGHKGTQLAADWLLSHVNDPTIDEIRPREYVLYACPTGPLLEQIQDFYHKSLCDSGRNSAHNYMPHITLSSVFKASDSAALRLAECLQDISEQSKMDFSAHMDLELFCSKNFIGLFINEEHSRAFKNLAVEYIRSISDCMTNDYDMVDVVATCFPWCSSPNMSYFSPSRGSIFRARSFPTEPSLKDLRLTLAYNFNLQHFEKLKMLAEKIDINSPCGWELRLYSRESRLTGKEVYKVLFSHLPRDIDELELLFGDFVYISPDQMEVGVDCWVEAISWLTGCSGLIPTNYIQRTAESDAWTLHEKQTIVPLGSLGRKQYAMDFHRFSRILQANEIEIPETEKHEFRESMSQSNENDHLRSLFVVRHGERVDFTFCDWIKKSFDLSGKYSPYDLNMPNNVPKRKPEEFFLDSPLTKLGNLQAFAVGEAFKRFNIKISHVYCSPALRCVETCSSILDGANLDAIHINIEPALFEWLSLLSPRKPKWFSVKELISFGYRINPSYLPVLSYEETLNLEETCQEFYRRNHLATECILEHCKPSGGNVLIVAHAGSLDSCTRQLLDKAPRNDRESSNLLRFIPYCSVFHCTQSRSNEKWSICNTPSFSFANSSNLKFESKRLQ